MMNRRGFIGVVGGIFGFLGFAKISNNANGGNSKNLLVVKFNNYRGYRSCCNHEEIFKDMPFKDSKVVGERKFYERECRECHVWIRQEDSVCCRNNGGGDPLKNEEYLMWGEVNMVEYRISAGSCVYGYFKECPQSNIILMNRSYWF